MSAPRRRAPGTRPRASRMPPDERMTEILSVARSVFSSRGFHATAVTEIAQQLGIAEGTVFKYFPTKRDLLNQVIEHWYGDLFGDYTKELSVIHGARNRLRYLIWRHLRTIGDWPGMCRLIFSDVRSQPGYSKSPLHRMNLTYTGLLMDVIREGIQAGEFRAGLPLELLRDLVYGGIEHHAWGFLYGSGTLDAERSADRLTALICGGIEAATGHETATAPQQLAELTGRLEQVVATLRRQADGTR